MNHPTLPLIFIRHGDTEWSRSGRYQGRSDPPLIGAGAAQALQLARRLQEQGIQSIFTSPLRRARETADVIAEELGLDAPVVDSRLTELDYGSWEGFTQTEIRLRWPDQLRQWKRAPELGAAPGGESLSAVRERLRMFLEDPRWSTHHASGVLVVSHSGPIRVALLQAALQPLSMFRRIAVPTGSMHCFMLHRSDGRLGVLSRSVNQAPCR